MERKRIEYPGAFYHVTQRGNNRENIFIRDDDKNRYLSNLVKLKEKYDFKLLGYVLMDNHYHLLLQTGENPLQKIIYRQNMFYSRFFNRTHNRSDHLYGDRYRAALIQDESYLFSVLRYIHWNPVEAGICARPEEYQWSSDLAYRHNKPEVVDVYFILNIIDNVRAKAVNEYRRMMHLAGEMNYDRVKHVGDDSFLEYLETQDEESKEQKKRITLEEIIKATGIDDQNFEQLKTGSRKRRLSRYKDAYVNEAIRQGYSYKEIGSYINITTSAVGLYRKPEIT